MILTRRQLLSMPLLLFVLAATALLRPLARTLPKPMADGLIVYKLALSSLYGKLGGDYVSAYPFALSRQQALGIYQAQGRLWRKLHDRHDIVYSDSDSIVTRGA